MNVFRAFIICLSLVYLPGLQAFTLHNLKTTTPSYSRRWANSSAADDAESSTTLVDKDIFVAAVDNLRTEMAKQDPSSASESKKDDDETFYAIGKVKVQLHVASGNPGMDLAESTGGLVLVSGVTGHALEAGIQMGDTIVGVSVPVASAAQETRAYSLEDTARVLMGAMKLAIENESTDIELELNRLIKMRYA